MEGKYYTNERNAQIIIYLLKHYGIRNIIASPGTTNMTFVASLQHDPFFKMYSCVDERSAAYMACGMAAESGEPVVITCTGATASRNYYPGLTEAFYRKLPVIAITSTQDPARVGQLCEQVIDRSQCAKDIVVYSEHIQFIEAKSDEWNVTVKVNKAFHALKKHGGGPIHLNLETRYSRDFSVKELPPARVIHYYDYKSQMPELPKGQGAVFIGSHQPMSSKLTEAIDSFCEATGSVVFCSHTSNYKGKYAVSNSLVAVQDDYISPLFSVDYLIHIGEVSGGDYQLGRLRSSQQWRVNEDGDLRDHFQGLTAVFEMPEDYFFQHYASTSSQVSESNLLQLLRNEYIEVSKKFPEVPFSNIWVCQQVAPKLPDGSVLHLGILNSLRSMNFFEIPKTVTCFSNTGGFGIDGDISSMIGASLAHPDKLYFCVVGDLAFFYDMNSIGNRHVGPNLRLIVINNGMGAEFRRYTHLAYILGDEAKPYVAAAGHFGNKSHQLLRHYAEDLGFEYLTASSKDEFISELDHFITTDFNNRSMLFEIFTTDINENDALYALSHIISDENQIIKRKAKDAIKNVIGDKGVSVIKSIIGKK